MELLGPLAFGAVAVLMWIWARRGRRRHSGDAHRFTESIQWDVFTEDERIGDNSMGILFILRVFLRRSDNLRTRWSVTTTTGPIPRGFEHRVG